MSERSPTSADNDEASADRRIDLLSAVTEAGRLKRAVPLAAAVDLQIADDDLVIAAVAKYNVVLDIASRRIQHGCRDFQGQAGAYHLCKHVAATLLALEEDAGTRIARELADGADARRRGAVAPWRFEVITRFAPGR